MDRIVSVVALGALLVWMGWRMPASRWPLILAATLGVIVLVVLAERSGLWPAGWQTR